MTAPKSRHRIELLMPLHLSVEAVSGQSPPDVAWDLQKIIVHELPFLLRRAFSTHFLDTQIHDEDDVEDAEVAFSCTSAQVEDNVVLLSTKLLDIPDVLAARLDRQDRAEASPSELEPIRVKAEDLLDPTEPEPYDMADVTNEDLIKEMTLRFGDLHLHAPGTFGKTMDFLLEMLTEDGYQVMDRDRYMS